MIFALVKVYMSERHGLKKCLDSLDNIDSIIVCDGRYPDSAWGTSDPKQLAYYRRRYPPGNSSTDKTREIAQSYSNAFWIPAPKEGWQSETMKMNRMLDFVQNDSWVLLIDPDERLVGNIRSAVPPSQCDVVGMRVQDSEGHNLYYYRLFKKKQGVSFATHHSLQFVNGSVVELYAGNSADHCYILHERIEIG